MKESEIFQVYNASAGSGKTFTLVKEYLKIILTSKDIFQFQKILAITFTNKAAGEMKERVLENLTNFSNGKQTDLFFKILEETTMKKEFVQEKSKILLDAILHNYTAFSITTIDSFTHKIIKSFAFDLGLPLSFDVEMDAFGLLNEAVDVLISKIGTQKELTDLLINFTLDKADEDKSWDISRELNEFSRILLNENDTKYFRKLADKNIADFTDLKTKLIHHQQKLKKELQKIGTIGIEIIDAAPIQYNDFSYSMLPKLFIALESTPEKAKFFDASKLRERIDNETLYGNSKSNAIKAAIEEILPELLRLYFQSEALYRDFLLNQLVLKGLIPLAVLSHVNSELSAIKKDNNIQLSSEFNQLISDTIKDQPAPFIYERIGQKFMHYFIDEMQDTSVLQWQNLIPLIDNALSQENSSLLLVGDGKQAIYRWRGGKADQFINLEEDAKNNFTTVPNITSLETNYRSYSEVINFNNSFFQHVSNFLNNETYKKMYVEGNVQKENSKKGGFVSLTFLEKDADKEENAIKYSKKILEKISELKATFSLCEICVLVRKKKDGIAVANYLSENGIEIISSDSLLLQNSEKVNFICNLLQVIQQPKDKETLLEIVYFLYDHLKITDDKHAFISKYIHQNIENIFHQLKAFGITFDLSAFHQFPFYEKIEEIIRSFQLIKTSDAYVQYFLDVVLEQQRKGTSIQEFLDFWDKKKEVLSIVAPATATAVQILTVHKSKGLEFPVVIFPYDIEIYRQISPKIWLDELPPVFSGFEELLVPFNESIKHVTSSGLGVYNQQRCELELDNFNLLYVALTRAEEQLHIITEKSISASGAVKTTNSSGIFIDYLMDKNLWIEDQLTYSFGESERNSIVKEKGLVTEIQKEFVSNSWKDHNVSMLASSSVLWDTKQGEAIKFGNLIHEVMAKVFTKKDVNLVVSQYVQTGIIDDSQAESILKNIFKIVEHPLLEEYFSENVFVYNEREILGGNNHILIPDRLVFSEENEVTIIDYKTGKPLESHYLQIIEYENILTKMDLIIKSKLLVYIDKEISVEVF